MRLPPGRGWRVSGARAPALRRVAFGASFLAGLCVIASLSASPALAQVNPLSPPATTPDNGQMLLQADQITYDNDRQLVTAEGGVQIFYRGQTVLADRVIYNRQTRRLIAEGGVRITDAQGNVTHGNTADLTDDLRDGFVRSLLVERKSDRTRFAADSGERQGDVSIFSRGTYTACEPCKDHPEKPPLWQIRAARIIHNQQEQIIYYENAQLEFFGMPIGYMPYLWGPDGTVKRQTGFLYPHIFSSSRVGTGGGIPYYLALSPFYDLTITPTYTTKEGLHLSLDWRHQLPNGWYRIRLSGIDQTDPDAVGIGHNNNNTNPATWDPGARRFRGGVESWGEFQLSDRWRFGWDISSGSDIRYFTDYGLWTTGKTERASTIYLQGRGDRSFFDMRAYYIKTLVFGGGATTFDDLQSFQPVVRPVIDYTKTMADPWFGGEFRVNQNLTSLSRNQGFAYSITNATTGNTRYLVRGFAGDYTRYSVNATWRKTFTDGIGQRWTPFFMLRGDVYNVDPANDRLYTTDHLDANGNQTFLTAEQALPSFFQHDNFGFRGMPTAGLDYRYPFIGTTPGATHIIEPIAQIIVRPNETHIGQLPNEDAQSLVFDDTTLFAIDKNSGYDRVEGGTRANIGLQYTYQTTTGFMASALFGQSYALSGLNSFARGTTDIAGAGLDSGLQTARSDYVARLEVQPWSFSDIIVRGRFAENDFKMRRLEVTSGLNVGPTSLQTTYTFIGAQPDLGFATDRQEVNSIISYKLDSNWSIVGGGRYSLRNTTGVAGWVSNQLGLRYTDDCFVFSLDYTNIYQGYGDIQPQKQIMARITLRTLGDLTLRTTAP